MVIAAAVVAGLAVAGDDGGETIEATTSTSTSEGAAPVDGTAPAQGAGPATAAPGDLPPAPWRTAAVPRDRVPAAYVAAWDRAGNRTGCALLFPLDGGPVLDGAEPSGERTPDDRGWDIFLTGAAGSVEILGLFDKSTQPDRPVGPPAFTRRWSDGSVARYGPDIGALPAGSADPNTSPFEAVLTLPDQSCVYRLYDTLGRAHLESTFDRLRLMSP